MNRDRMSIMSVRLILMAVVSAFTAPLVAQHGGGHTGHAGAGVGSAPVFRGGSIPFVGRPGSVGSVQYRIGQSSGPILIRRGSVGSVQYRIGQSSGPILINRPGPVAPAHRLGFGFGEANRRRGFAGERRENRVLSVPFFGVGLPYGVGLAEPGFLGYPDAGFYDDSAVTAPVPAASYSNEPAVQPAQEEAEAAPEAAPISTHRPAYQRPLPPPAEPEPEDAVTLVFKDGRPNEQIRNYMLTRTTLYVQEKRLREIAVADLDLDATAKLNREAGVDFRLPDGK